MYYLRYNCRLFIMPILKRGAWNGGNVDLCCLFVYIRNNTFLLNAYIRFTTYTLLKYYAMNTVCVLFQTIKLFYHAFVDLQSFDVPQSRKRKVKNFCGLMCTDYRTLCYFQISAHISEIQCFTLPSFTFLIRKGSGKALKMSSISEIFFLVPPPPHWVVRNK
jgi:hypothetical protein